MYKIPVGIVLASVTLAGVTMNADISSRSACIRVQNTDGRIETVCPDQKARYQSLKRELLPSPETVSSFSSGKEHAPTTGSSRQTSAQPKAACTGQNGFFNIFGKSMCKLGKAMDKSS